VVILWAYAHNNLEGKEIAMIEIDVRGFIDPEPVIRTQKAIRENPKEELIVLLETVTDKENVSRLAQSKGYSIKEEKLGDDFRIQLIPLKK